MAEASMDKFDQITSFVRVVELGGFAAAARDLAVAPSLVTAHIKALEQRLGARLLNRNTRHVKPTEVGEAYYKYCVDVLNRLDQAESLVESMQAKPRGVLRLNTSVIPAPLITPVIADYTAQFPEVSVRLIATVMLISWKSNSTFQFVTACLITAALSFANLPSTTL
jgi:DNA-binding transcriptional LysR family regulator